MPVPAHAPLTSEEVRILKLAAAGYTDERIAREVGLSRSTVQRRLHAVSERLGATSRLSMVLRALQAGVIRIPHLYTTPVRRTAQAEGRNHA